jgi:hypothetical protein
MIAALLSTVYCTHGIRPPGTLPSEHGGFAPLRGHSLHSLTTVMASVYTSHMKKCGTSLEKHDYHQTFMGHSGKEPLHIDLKTWVLLAMHCRHPVACIGVIRRLPDTDLLLVQRCCLLNLQPHNWTACKPVTFKVSGQQQQEQNSFADGDAVSSRGLLAQSLILPGSITLGSDSKFQNAVCSTIWRISCCWHAAPPSKHSSMPPPLSYILEKMIVKNAEGGQGQHFERRRPNLASVCPVPHTPGVPSLMCPPTHPPRH